MTLCHCGFIWYFEILVVMALVKNISFFLFFFFFFSPHFRRSLLMTAPLAFAYTAYAQGRICLCLISRHQLSTAILCLRRHRHRHICGTEASNNTNKSSMDCRVTVVSQVWGINHKTYFEQLIWFSQVVFVCTPRHSVVTREKQTFQPDAEWQTQSVCVAISY